MKPFTQRLKTLIGVIAIVPFSLIGALVMGAMASKPDNPEPVVGQELSRSILEENRTLTFHKYVEVDGLNIFYREAGPADAPTILLLHGFPTSSHMFRNLIPQLADRFHVVAPDYPGFGNSSMPRVDQFTYTFDNLANVVEKFVQAVGLQSYSLYLMDYGAPVGFRLAVRYPERVESLIIQNGNAYEEGLRDFWKPFRTYWKSPTPEHAKPLEKFLNLLATKWQYTHGVRDVASISPDNWLVDQYLLDRPGNKDIQLQLFYSYGSNPPLYPEWQEYLREHQPPTLIVWGQHDQIFPADGAYPYRRDLKDVEFHLLDTGHFALEEDGTIIADYIRRFLDTRVVSGRAGSSKENQS
ncbi:MAG: alpha/beta hydrolase [Nitrospira sp.]|nr:alpha/beta hydrolase [Nitrospira sp.]